MKLYLSNLGRIKRAEIEPRGFTVFVGPNNTNKTWAAYAFYGIAKQLASSTAFIEHQHWSEFDFDFVSSLKISEGLFERTHEETRKVIKLLQQESADATAVHVARKSLIPMDVTDTEEEVRIESAMLEEILALPSKSLSGAKARLLLNRDDLNSRVKADRISVQSEGSRVEAMLLAKSSSRNLASFGIALSDPEHDFEIIENRLVSMMRRLALGIFSNVHVFPAERKMLANLADRFSPWMLSSFHEKALNLAVRDYMNFLFRSELPSNLNNDLIKKNEYISALLEQEVLGARLRLTGTGNSS